MDERLSVWFEFLNEQSAVVYQYRTILLAGCEAADQPRQRNHNRGLLGKLELNPCRSDAAMVQASDLTGSQLLMLLLVRYRTAAQGLDGWRRERETFVHVRVHRSAPNTEFLLRNHSVLRTSVLVDPPDCTEILPEMNPEWYCLQYRIDNQSTV